ncbi:MAG: transcript cleavage factor [Chlamydiae bacterium]|nr:transcript cleavage factor [Chlamydiota bacterium]
MSYLKEFLQHINNHDYPPFLRLWEEYCSGDEIDGPEVIQILKSTKNADFRDYFGKHVDRILPLWEKMPECPEKHEILKLVMDIQTLNSMKLREMTYDYLKSTYGSDKYFQEKMKLIGMRDRDGKDPFQGAISSYQLLSHINKGKFVFHTGGWGVGEISDFSLIREQLRIEFDLVPGKKDVSFETAFKTLLPIPDDHFLAQRFGNPDALEKKAKEDPVFVIKLLLKDLGPRTAAEIKDELADLVIPAAEWTKWWQNTRGKLKKDTMVETPEDIKKPFRLRLSEVTHEERLQKALENKPDANTLIQLVYSFMKDFPETLKNLEFKNMLYSRITEMLTQAEINKPQQLQLYFFLQDIVSGKSEYDTKIIDLVKKIPSTEAVEELIDQVAILSFKKRLLVEIRKNRSDWKEIFLTMLLPADQNTLRDYIIAELLADKNEAQVKEKLVDLYTHPENHPETFLWYFQKSMSQKKLPFSDKAGRLRFFESLLILLSKIESKIEYRDTVKKIHGILSGERYAIVRQMMPEATVEEVKEFLLLSTKCHSLTDHDIKIFHSLAEVAHPSLAKSKKSKGSSSEEDVSVIWTTQEGFNKLQEKIKHIATVETVENAKEIEVARAHGDLRENAEFKAALERRDRLQSELKFLSDQMNKTRVITESDIDTEEVGVGCIVECTNKDGKASQYTLLGPWDADPEQNILAFQSKLAQAMKGLSVGDKFQFQEDEFVINKIRSYL